MDLSVLIIVAGLLLTVMLIKNPRPWVKMGMKLYMIFLYLWIAIAYYAICCDERSYNGALAMFWVVMATIWVWDAITGYTTFERTYKYDILSYVLLILPFVISFGIHCERTYFSRHYIAGNALLGNSFHDRSAFVVLP